MLKYELMDKNFSGDLSAQELRNILLENDVKPTIQRIEILDFLLKNRIHPSVEDIYVELEDKIPTLSKTTVYNTLNLFRKKNLVQFLTIEENEIRFDIDVRPHAHFKCKVCGKIYDLDNHQFSDFNGKTVEGHVVEETYIFLKGICKDCASKKNN